MTAAVEEVPAPVGAPPGGRYFFCARLCGALRTASFAARWNAAPACRRSSCSGGPIGQQHAREQPGSAPQRHVSVSGLTCGAGGLTCGQYKTRGLHFLLQPRRAVAQGAEREGRATRALRAAAHPRRSDRGTSPKRASITSTSGTASSPEPRSSGRRMIAATGWGKYAVRRAAAPTPAAA